ncbi:mitochondrial carrier [Clavulina sp. PMI_390]|nr:mitochondrial carrier [Clavulina sp. PMI_390]
MESWEKATFMMFIITVFSVLIFLALLTPVQGVVTRFRINFTPKGVGLGEQGDEQALSQDMRVGPVVNSVWEMFSRVRRIEGTLGFFKGLSTSFTAILRVVSFPESRTTVKRSSLTLILINASSSAFWALVLTLISIPGEILVNRAVTTPHKLPWFQPRIALRALFTPYERSKPWVLYLTPGLALAQTLHVLYFLIVARGLRAVLVPSYTPNNFILNGESLGAYGGFWAYLGMAAYAAFLIASVLVLTPLEVLSARLSVQRNHPRGATALPTSASAAGMNDDDGGIGLEYAGAEEDVIALRNEDEPYQSLVDAYRKVVMEEGTKTLYRCWWLTLLATLGSGYA